MPGGKQGANTWYDEDDLYDEADDEGLDDEEGYSYQAPVRLSQQSRPASAAAPKAGQAPVLVPLNALLLCCCSGKPGLPHSVF